ncbi:MAG: aminotransferase class V-fold PLP-dependent enzyme [Pseudomonadota bacterium]
MLTRRTCLTAGPAALLATGLGTEPHAAEPFDPASPLPHKEAFAPFASTYLNSASQHPLSIDATAAAHRYLQYKSFSTSSDYSNGATYLRVLEKFAQLIGADNDEVCYVQSTTVGENLLLKALGLPARGARLVTDELHYVGSLPTYRQLADAGTEVVTARADPDGRIDLDQFEKAINRDTRLVTVSLVSMVNGFQHDLTELCRIAHAQGALVYADIVQAVGSVPFDVRESGVDACATASYKWLMGEQGLGFLYVRRDRLEQMERPWYGHYQLEKRVDLGFPNPERLDSVTEFSHVEGARGYFAMGSQANVVAAVLDSSLSYLQSVGPERIAAHRQPLIDRLQDVMPSLGYRALTPRGSVSALVSFRHDGNTAELRERLAAANIVATVARHHLRISLSVFNDSEDVERLLDALRG